MKATTMQAIKKLQRGRLRQHLGDSPELSVSLSFHSSKNTASPTPVTFFAISPQISQILYQANKRIVMFSKFPSNNAILMFSTFSSHIAETLGALQPRRGRCATLSTYAFRKTNSPILFQRKKYKRKYKLTLIPYLNNYIQTDLNFGITTINKLIQTDLSFRE